MTATAWIGTAADGDWETAGNWSNGQPAANYEVYFSPAATNGPTTNLDRTGDTAGAGLVLARIETAPGCTYDIGSSGTPLKCIVSDSGGSTNVGPLIHRGTGSFYWNSEKGTSPLTSGQVVVDSANAQDAMFIGGDINVNQVIVNNGYVSISNTGDTQHLFLVPTGISTTLKVVCGVTGFKVTNTMVLGGTLDTTSRHNYIQMQGGTVINRNDLGGGGFGFAYVSMFGGRFEQRQDSTLVFGNTLYFYAIGGTLDTTKIALATVDQLYVADGATILRGAGLTISNEFDLDQDL